MDGRLAGVGLLVALASIVVLYGGTSAVAGTRPDDAERLAPVAAFFGQAGVGLFLAQGLISAFGLTFFAVAWRRYARPLARSAWAEQVVDLGAAIILVEVPVLVVSWGLELALTRLVALGDPATLGVFLSWDWIDNGTMLWLEVAWTVAIGLAAVLTGALPRWLGLAGIGVGALIAVFAAPAVALRYPLGTSLIAYGPFMLWMLAAGITLVRGRAPAAEV